MSGAVSPRGGMALTPRGSGMQTPIQQRGQNAMVDEEGGDDKQSAVLFGDTVSLWDEVSAAAPSALFRIWSPIWIPPLLSDPSSANHVLLPLFACRQCAFCAQAGEGIVMAEGVRLGDVQVSFPPPNSTARTSPS